MQHSPAENDAELKLEIAYVLLIDIVGYSRLLANDQVESLNELNSIVRNSHCFRAAEAAEKLIRLPTGDGMALLFFSSPEEPAKCAVEISKGLQARAHLPVRMGVHSGPVNRLTDVNDRSNITGPGINIAQRVMDCGDAGHILLSKHVADDLADYRYWRPFLHDIGEYEVKHGVRLKIVNLFAEGVGNSLIPQKFRRSGRWRQTRNRILPIVVAVTLSVAGIALGIWPFFHRLARPAAETISPILAISEKSIAVLPFESLSDDKRDAYFADGVQDEILTDLSKLRNLKVISRTSVMQYRGESKRNLREIAKALGVNYALEGSVQRSNDRVRVSAQLIDARTDTHVWAEHYDRPLADVFAIQSEVAETIVGQLSIKLSPAQKTAIEQRPTADLAAFDSYIRAKDLIERSVFSAPRDQQLIEAVALLGNAVQRDPNFAAAYYQLAHAHDQIYFLGADHTPQRLTLAEAAIRELRNLRPDSPEAHLANAKHLYWCYRDYDGSRRELAKVDDKLPNDPWPYLILGYMDRRQSRWQESTRNLQRALELDPRNFSILQQMAITYEDLRRYSEAISMIDRAIAIKSDDIPTLIYRAFLEVVQRGRLGPLRTAIDQVLTQNPAEIQTIASEWLTLASRERKPDEMKRALAALPEDGCRDETFLFPRAWCEGKVALLLRDVPAAQKAFSEARRSIEKTISEQPNYAEAICIKGVIDAALGRGADAVKEGNLAVELVPLEKDSLVGARMIYYLGLIYSLIGDNNLAIQQLEKSARIPCGVTYDDLLLEPQWDGLRSDPRFAKLVASLAPKD